MPFQQPPLPYPLGGLQPFLSEEQMSFHYGKHHAGYFTRLNGLLDGKPEADHTLRQVVIESTGAVFNNAAQAWNHTFFWNCLSPDGGGQPNGALAEAIDKQCGGLGALREAFSNAAVGLFGSGWTWLARNPEGKLEIMALGNADTPLKHGREPLLVIDLWEHAYYIDYRNERPRFIQAFWDKVNWEFVGRCLEQPAE